MQPSINERHPLHRWFSGLVEHAMYGEVGLADPTLVDYLSALLTNFIHIDRIYAVRDDLGQPLAQVADMLAYAARESTMQEPTRERFVHRHIGDFTLFWTGLFPEYLKRLCGRSRRDHFIDYFEQGKRSYAIASELSGENTKPPAALLRRLSDCFEHCVHGLGVVRQEVRVATAAPDNLMLDD